MARNECPAVNCGRGIGREYFMCRDHWYMVPMRIRNAISRLYRDGKALSLPHRVAGALAVREVGIREETVDPGDQPCDVEAWQTIRDKLKRDEPPECYRAEVKVSRRRLEWLMNQTGASCPLETCSIVLALENDPPPDAGAYKLGLAKRRRDVRIAAALEVWEANKNQNK